MAEPAYDHIVVVMMENHDYSEIIGNPQAPYINALAASSALLTNYTALTHPSEPNYLGLYAGSTFGVANDSQYTEPDPTLATILESAGKTFTGYVESGGSSYDHNPWESFPEGFSVEKDFSTFPSSSNFASLPTVSFVIPNVNDDMHNGTIQQGDTWLQTNMSAYAQWAQTNNSLLVVVWDEGDVSPNNQVAAILSGAGVVPGDYSAAYNHYNLLSTLLAASNLTGPGNAATTAPIDVWGGGGPPCFCGGTLILTDRGEVVVEALAEGDRVVTRSGALAPVRWIGRRRVDLRRHPDRASVQPVRVQAGAFGAGLPRRDLLVSPEHAIFVDGVLIPARHLVGCAGIAIDVLVDVTTYYHIELPQHDVLLAEGLPCESWLDTGNRAMFENGDVASIRFLEQRGADDIWTTQAAAPPITGGPILDAVRRRLAAAPVLDVAIDRTGQHSFVVAPGDGVVRLVSAVGYAAGDARALGAAVSSISLNGVGIGLTDERLGRGFHPVEAAWRWTNGAGHLTLEARDQPRTLVVEVSAVAQPRTQAAGTESRLIAQADDAAIAV